MRTIINDLISDINDLTAILKLRQIIIIINYSIYISNNMGYDVYMSTTTNKENKMKANIKELKKLAAEAKLAMIALESARLAYKKMDEITEQIIKSRADLSEFGIVIVDNFADKNKVWKSSAVARFELKLVKAG